MSRRAAHRRSLTGWLAAAVTAAALLVALLVALPAPANAALRAFTPVFSTNTTGDIVIRGNTLMTCPTSAGGCTSGRAGGNATNNSFAMVHVDVDADPATFNSSSATVTLPPGATVLYAGLSWGGITSAGVAPHPGVPAPDASRIGLAKLKAPGAGSYTTVTSTQTDTNTTNYQGYADVTSVVAAAGSGSYTVADVQAGTGAMSYAAWSLTVAYEDVTEPERNLVVFTGYDNLRTNGPAVDLPVTGFLTPATGPVVTRLGVVAYEGDKGTVGDTMSLDGTPVSNSLNPTNDVLNSSISDLNVPVTAKVPDYRNTLGFDIDRFDVSGYLDNGATGATIRLATSGDGFYPGVLTFATNLYATTLSAGKSVTDVNGGDVNGGDRLDYSVAVTNTGTDAAVSTVLTDAVPAGTAYLPGSLSVDGVAVSDSSGNDRGEVVAGNVTARLGTGATGTLGGRLAAAATSTVQFSVTVATGGADGAEISNIASFSYKNETTGEGFAGASDTVTSNLVVPPTLTFPAPPPGQLGTAFSTQLTRSGGTGPFTWTVSAGSLPPGITLRSGTGLLSGTPTTAGTFSFTVQVTDANSRTDTRAGTLVVDRRPVTLSLAVSDPSVDFGTQVTFTATAAPSAATGTVVFTDVPVSGPASGQPVVLGAAALTGGVAEVTVPVPAFGLNTVTATSSGDPAHAGATSTAVAVEVAAYAGEVIVTEFRQSGPDGADDSYVELRNTGPAAPMAGFVVTSGSGATTTLPQDAGTLGTGRSYLLTGADFSLGATATADSSATSLGSGGLAVSAPDTAGTCTDAVGPAGGPHSGTPLMQLTGSPTGQTAWWRTPAAGQPVDTGDNAADFALVSTDGGVHGGVQSTIGSPSPTGTADESQRNDALTSTLLDGGPASAAPNRVYVSGSPGTLTVRRTLTNTSAEVVTDAKVRITALSALHGLPLPGSVGPPAPHAALRVVGPATATSSVPLPGSGGGAVTVHNLDVDAPSGVVGGGLNSTLAVPLPSGGLLPGDSVSVAFTFAVDARGPFWFGYDVDALTAPPG